MNALIVLLFSAVVVSAHPQGGWGAPPSPIVDLEMSGVVALTGAGSGQAVQGVSESASGNADLASLSGVGVAIDQAGDVIQLGSVDLSGGSPSTSTLQGVSGTNSAIATDVLVAEITADNIAVQNAAATSVEGTGALAASGESSNNVIGRKH